MTRGRSNKNQGRKPHKKGDLGPLQKKPKRDGEMSLTAGFPLPRDVSSLDEPLPPPEDHAEDSGP
jgi:hypothetical protein